jgi:endoglucanase
MKGFYHQRSGIPLAEPFTPFIRPRPYHPADGLKVYASDVTLMETRNGLNLLGEANNFAALNRNVTDRRVANAWGGYFDAADWDRRIQHLSASRYHLELLELFPEAFAGLDLNIPESGDAIPDLLDEALFNIDCYRRLQTADGGIRGGIEAAEHPVRGETSWLESLRVMAYAPGPWSSYLYANVAARAATLLRTYDAERASALERSAGRAWDWAERHGPAFAQRYGDHARWSAVSDERRLAALELYRLTGRDRWHARYLKGNPSAEGGRPAGRSLNEEQLHALFLYARLPADRVQAEHQRIARDTLIELADRSLDSAERNAWGLVSCTVHRALGTGWFSTPDLIPLIRAYHLSRATRYLDAIVRGIQFSVGANPMNMTYTTGVGHVWPYNAMVLDSRRTARAVPAGITVFGQVDYNEARERNNRWHLGALDWFLVRKGAIYPDPFAWPVTESYWDIHQWPSACEFTPQSTMGKVSYIWGSLAAQSRNRSGCPSVRPGLTEAAGRPASDENRPAGR